MFVDKLLRIKRLIKSSIKEALNINVVPEFDYIAFEANNTKDLRSRIAFALNCESAENGSDTPDWILAEYLLDCLATWDKAVQAREKWYNRPCGRGEGITAVASINEVNSPITREPNVKRNG